VQFLVGEEDDDVDDEIPAWGGEYLNQESTK
jgi:hypothetical protein